MDKKELYKNIDLYFEASLSLAEEAELLRELLRFEGQDPRTDEALAVMLASRPPAKPAARKKKKKPARLMVGIAASVAVVFAIGAVIHNHSHQQDGRMFAYVGGVKIENPQEIMKIIDNQLNDIGESSDFFSRTLSTDLDDIREALISDDI